MIFISYSADAEICTNSSCVKLTKEFVRYIDTTSHPCEDFYRFACGNFVENIRLDKYGSRSRSVEDITGEEIQSEIRNMLEQPIETELLAPRAFNLAKKFYRACMNESAIEAEGLKKIKQIFKQIGGWPTLEGNNWNEKEFDWTNAVHKLRGIGVNFDVFFRISVDKDKRKNNSYILGIHDMQYGPPELREDVKRTYIDFLSDIAILFGANTYRAKKDSEDVLSLFLEVAKIYKETSRNNTQTKNASRMHDYMNLSELQHQHSSINWYGFLYKLLNPVSLLINEVMVEHPESLRRIELLIRSTPKRKLANFIIWHTLQYLITFAPHNVLNRAEEFIDKMNGEVSQKPRWQKCLGAVEERLGAVLSASYIQRFIQQEKRDNIIDMITRIKFEFRRSIQKQTWLDEDTKKMVLEKLLSSSVEIPYYERLLEILAENKVYDEVEIHEEQFLQSAMNIDYLNFNRKFSMIGKEIDGNLWKDWHFVSGTDIEYSAKKNSLIFPVGILGGIFYQSDRPEYMNYGILGSIIAHEMSHIFIKGVHLGVSNRELRSWWSPDSLLSYEEKLKCLHNQYEKFVVRELNKHLNPEKTRDEDFADLAGMKISYDTYINWVQENGAEPLLPGLNYSSHQLFWISSAIRHCAKYSRETLERHIDNYQWSPRQFRVNGPLQNLKEFAFDFGCLAKAPMNPERKCRVWSF